MKALIVFAVLCAMAIGYGYDDLTGRTTFLFPKKKEKKVKEVEEGV